MSTTETVKTAEDIEKRYAQLIAKAAEKIASMKADLERATQRDHEPIAIIGMGCRFPLADNPESYWELLANGVDAMQDAPAHHAYLNAYYDPDPEALGKVYTRRAGFLQQPPADFDADFFGISAVEAASMDPQHRLLLEVTWEALENAGIVPEALSGSITGVFTGICSSDYVWNLVKQDASKTDVYLGSGNAYSPAAGRVSFLLDIHGPCMAVDTGCASSLSSTYLGVNSLRRGECDMAIVGGVQRYLSAEYWVNLCRSRILSPDARCKTFSADADGYARGEGCGVVILKRLSDAVRDGDNITAVIQGIAMAHGGRTSGLTVPNGSVQQKVIRSALQNAKVQPTDIDYIEAHGTGTSLGDPIEMNAIGKVFRQRNIPLMVGSAKTNIGHLEGSAGIAGLIKVALSLKNEAMPKHLHFTTPSPHIAWDEMPVKIVTEKMPWKKSDKKRFGGLSSFGFEGVNVHAVVTEAPEVAVQNTSNNTTYLITLSAKSEAALNELVNRYVTYLNKHSNLNIGDVAYTMTARRAHHDERLAVVVSSVSSLGETLKVYLSHQKDNTIFRGRRKNNHHTEVDLATLKNTENYLTALAQQYADGAAIDWAVFYQDEQHRVVELPTYAWQRKPYWIDVEPAYQSTKNTIFEEETYLSEEMLMDNISSNHLIKQLKSMGNQERRNKLINHIREQLPVAEDSEWNLEDSFFDMGMNSLALVELRLRLQTALDMTLPSTLLYTHPTMEALTDYLLQEMEASTHGH